MAVSGIRTQEAVTINERNQLGMKNGKNTEKVTPSMEFSDINFFFVFFFVGFSVVGPVYDVHNFFYHLLARNQLPK